MILISAAAAFVWHQTRGAEMTRIAKIANKIILGSDDMAKRRKEKSQPATLATLAQLFPSRSCNLVSPCHTFAGSLSAQCLDRVVRAAGDPMSVPWFRPGC